MKLSAKWLALALAGAGILGSAAMAQAAPITACDPGAFAAKYPSLAGREIKIAQDGQSGPYSYRDPANFDSIIGSDADMARAAMECIGLKNSFMLGSWSGLLPAVLASQADIMWDGLSYNADRAKQVNFTLYMHQASAGMVQKGNPKKITALDSLCGLRAAAGLATSEAAVLADQNSKCVAAGEPPIEIITYPDVPSAQRLISNDRTDVIVTDLGVIAGLTQAQPELFERAFTLPSSVIAGPAFRKDDQDLANAVTEAMQILYANGTLKTIEVKYGFDPILIQEPKLVTN